jgi:YggT family protein
MIVQRILCTALTVYFVILLVRIILSWVPSMPDPLRPLAHGVRALTDPLLLPLRGLLPPVRVGMGALDLSPLVLFFAISILRGLLCGGGGL